MVIRVSRYKNVYLIGSAALLLGILVSFIFLGLRFGIEFTGGSILEVSYEQERPAPEEIREQLAGIGVGEIIVQPIGEQGVVLRMERVSPETHQQILNRLEPAAQEQSFESIGPVVGQELRNQTLLIVGLALLAILFYITVAFRHIVQPLRSWQYSLASILALAHDLLLPLGVLAVLGVLYQVQISIPIVVALLTVLGYSINNTVVVFDRIRENLAKDEQFDFETTVNASIRQTLSRNINTSLTTLLVLGAIFFFGGETLRYFALTLMVGIVAGTYSSILLAPSFLMALAARRVKGA